MINLSKKCFILFLFFCCIKIYAQNINYSTLEDSINIKQVLKIERLEKQIEDAKKQGNLYAEMLLLMDLIYFKINDLGDITSSYEDLRNLEKLVLNNPNEGAVREVETPLYLLLGSTLRDISKFDEALSYFDMAILAAQKYGYLEYYNDISCLRAEMLALTGRREEAINVFKSLERKAVESFDSIFRNRIYEVRSSFYKHDQQMDSALFYAKKSIDDFSQNNQRAFRLCSVAECYLVLNKDMDSVVYYAKKGLEIAINFNLEKEQRYAHDMLRQAYNILGNYKDANEHFEKFYELEQQQRSYKNALSIGNYNTKQVIENSRIKDELANEKLSKQRLIIWLVSGSLFLLIVALFYIFNRLKLIRKQNLIIEQEKYKAEQSERFKEQFLANMSHEIRTPLYAISGMINSLERNPHPKTQDIFLDAMKTSSENLMVLLNDILDLSKIDSGKLEIEEIPMNPIEVIENVVKTLHYRASEKGLELKAEIAHDFPNRIIGDPSRLNQILINLVGNAIKFTNKGHVKIMASKSADYLEFAIKDTGPGISEDQIDLIFEVFKQGEKSKSQILGGTGLGLSISKQLVELQNGTLKVENVLGKGSTFYLKLPIKLAETFEDVESLFGEKQLKETGNLLKGIRILLVEDDDFNVLVVQDDLTYYIPEVSIEVVKNGEEAVNMFTAQNFDIILMDKHMPVLNGCEASEKIRELERVRLSDKRVPIIAMTASLLKSEIEECITAGMDGFIPKPYKPEELITTLYKIVKSH